MTLYFITGALALALGVALGYIIRQVFATRNLNSVESKTKHQLEEAKIQAKEVLLDAKDKAVKIFEDAKNQERERLAVLTRQEERLNSQIRKVEDKENALENRKVDIEHQANLVKAIRQEAEVLKTKSEEMLEHVAGMSSQEARNNLFKKVEEESKIDLVAAISKMEKNRIEELEKRAREIMTVAVQRYARSHVSEITTSTVNLPSDDLKGRIIGKEGRNIRTLER